MGSANKKPKYIKLEDNIKVLCANELLIQISNMDRSFFL